MEENKGENIININDYKKKKSENSSSNEIVFPLKTSYERAKETLESLEDKYTKHLLLKEGESSGGKEATDKTIQLIKKTIVEETKKINIDRLDNQENFELFYNIDKVLELSESLDLKDLYIKLAFFAGSIDLNRS